MSRILEVPLLEPDSFLTIDVGTDLADDPAEVCQLLTDEKCAPKWWLAIASAYARRQLIPAACQVVHSGLENCAHLETEESKAPFHAMLSWLHLASMRQAETSQKRENYDNALQCGNRAFQSYQATMGDAQRLSVPAVLAQGALYSAVGNVNDALQCFQTVLAVQPMNVYAKLGRARVLYARRNFRGALKLYQEVLRQAPKANPGVLARIGCGICFWRLRDRVKAKKAWLRALDTASASPDTNGSAEGDEDKSSASIVGSNNIVGVCHALLGISELNEALHGQRAAFAAHYTAAIEHFQQAFKLGVTALPALKIASYLFSKHDMARVGKLTDVALATATRPELLGEAMFWKARAAHYAGDLDLALTLYTQATSAYPENIAASIGKSIIELCQDRVPEALLTLELVVQSHPKDPNGLLYAGLFAAKTDATKARALLESYVNTQKQSKEPLRYEALVTLAQLWEVLDPAKALGYLRHAQSLLPETPRALRINIGTLAFALRDYTEAELQFAAIENPDLLVRYNLARAREAKAAQENGSFEEIVREYQSLPVLEARARLTLIGDLSVAEKLAAVEHLVEQYPDNLELRALYAWHLRDAQSPEKRGSTAELSELANKEQELLKSTLTSHDKHDTYALVALGNVYLRNAASQKSDRERQVRAYVRAAELFEKALQIDRHNAYAAQGVAVALAATRRAKLAQSVFSRLRETLVDNHSTTVNSANCLMDVGDYARAAELYAVAYSKHPSKELATLLAWSWFARGCRAKDVQALSTALEWANTALRESTESESSSDFGKFNVALIQLQLGDVIRRKPVDQRSLSVLEPAYSGVQSAVALFQTFSTEASSLPFNSGDLEEKADTAEHTVLPQLAQAIEEQREYERKAEEKRLQAVKQREEELKIVMAAKEQEEAARIAREQELAQERERLQKEAMEWEAQRQARREAEEKPYSDDEKPKKKSSKKGKKKRKNDSDAERDEDEAPTLPSDNDSEPELSGDDEPARVQRKTMMDDSDEDDYDADTKETNDNAEDSNAAVEDESKENKAEDETKDEAKDEAKDEDEAKETKEAEDEPMDTKDGDDNDDNEGSDDGLF